MARSNIYPFSPSSFAVAVLLFCVIGAKVTDAKEELRDRDAKQVEMKAQNLAVAALPLAANAINVVLSNDDGWVS